MIVRDKIFGIDRRCFLTQAGLITLALVTSNKSKIMKIPKGVTIRLSEYSVEETINRIAYFLQGKGATIYARIDQQHEVARVGKRIAPLEFIMFGNPKAGFGAMSAVPVAALDLPLKIIAWEDENKQVWIAYNQQIYIRERYELPADLIAGFDLDAVVSSALSI
ncbi:DUF302 domain-containing protein [Pedobacter jamesrossensis]|uniref:DUF302 domain-containing protein n=1 Tax=Pedobacter jamesrossensis TaxID=1908238 RepID=A0ABV8NJA8_9SPHI